jgi:hypothetical protein
MTGSRTKRLAYALALLAPFAAAPVAAQWSDDKPPVLTPDDYPPEAGEDDPVQPPGSVPAAQNSAPDVSTESGDAPSDGTANGAPRPLQTGAEVTALPPPGQDIEVETLGTAEGPPAGTLDPSTGGLDGNIWSGSGRAGVLDLLTRAPLASADPTLRDAAKRIILTRAAAPVGPAKHAFVTARIEKLLDAGLIEDAGALASQAAIPNDADFARMQATALLIAGRADDVCSDKTAMRLASDDVFWMQLRAYCAAASGDQPTAELTNSVLKAQGNDDPAYDTLVEDVLNRYGTEPGPIAHPTAMHVFLFQHAGLPLPPGVARTMDTAETLLVMRDARNTPRTRFEAAERIVTTGAASVDELKAIADAQDLPQERVANAYADAPNLPFFMGQVLLRRAAVIEPRPEVKARLAAEALSLGRKFDLLPLASALQADAIASIKPSPSNRPQARLFARALLLAGRPDAALRWATGDAVMQTVAGMASQDPSRMAAVQTSLDAFATGLIKDPPDPDADRSYKALILGLADVLGLPMPPDARAQAASIESQMWDGQRPGPGLMRSIQEVSLRPERRGEALLMILDAIHKIGFENLAPDVTIEFVRLLGNMNQQETARAVALDALAQYVPPPLPAPAAPAQ